MTSGIEQTVREITACILRCNNIKGKCSKRCMGLCYSITSCKYKELINFKNQKVFIIDFVNAPLNPLWVTAKDIDEAKSKVVELRNAAALHTEIYAITEWEG